MPSLPTGSRLIAIAAAAATTGNANGRRSATNASSRSFSAAAVDRSSARRSVGNGGFSRQDRSSPRQESAAREVAEPDQDAHEDGQLDDVGGARLRQRLPQEPEHRL